MSAVAHVKVLPDVPAIDRAFDYAVPEELGSPPVGTVVRVPLAGRRVSGWVVSAEVDPEPGLDLAQVTAVIGHGPSADTIELCRWVAWRWAGRLATVLRLATPGRAVRSIPPERVRPARVEGPHPIPLPRSPGVHVAAVSPIEDPVALARQFAGAGQVIVVAPSVLTVDRVAAGLRSAGAGVGRWPGDWAAAAAGASVVGGRSAVFAPAPRLAGILVLDEHDEALQSESSPTWHARDVAVERARRAGVPCVLVSPCPTVDALAHLSGPLPDAPSLGAPGGDAVGPPSPDVEVARSRVRAGWAPLEVVDRRGEDVGRTGLYSSRAVSAIRETARSGRRVVCLLNRTGRARLLACRSCGGMAECAVCSSAVRSDDSARLVCDRCGAGRPPVCASCGSSALASLRIGVSRAREELEALAREPVQAVTAASSSSEPDAAGARVVVGTEAALHRVPDAGLVVVLDLDQELLAPRYRAAEEALSLLVRATRLVGGRSRGGRVMVQTRLPEHEVVRAALGASPLRVAEAEHARRQLLGFPPYATVAVVRGEAAPAYIDAVGSPEGVEVLHPDEDRWILRSSDRSALLDHLAGVRRPPGRLRLHVDPSRVR